MLHRFILFFACSAASGHETAGHSSMLLELRPMVHFLGNGGNLEDLFECWACWPNANEFHQVSLWPDILIYILPKTWLWVACQCSM